MPSCLHLTITLTQLNTPTGNTVRFKLTAQYAEGMCGCVFRVPLLRLSSTTMTVVTNQGPVAFVRPPNFDADRIELVDASLTRTSRTWFNHFDGPPEGISQDGTKIYFGTGYDHEDLTELLVEISEEGTVRLVPRADPDIVTQREEILDFPKDPMNSYLGYFRFKGKSDEYILRFSWPCN